MYCASFEYVFCYTNNSSYLNFLQTNRDLLYYIVTPYTVSLMMYRPQDKRLDRPSGGRMDIVSHVK